ncbi:hypothetical protein QAD02_024419 [Eretmocerus hayati]|uniref:Uncharacterized protein n=1 Tax=Eretmocerus hayati TaxID=131215 RepID=A0ACC2Q185_9HYME|nr:hypothetical protein QAD02_024419 [Eretmocerus hayati]
MDPNITWNTADPDLTECFQKTVLIWSPCTILWVFAPYEYYKFRKSKNRNIPRTWLFIAKFLMSLMLILLAISDLVGSINSSLSGHVVYNVDYVTPGIRTFTFTLSLVLLACDKKYGFRTSGLLWTFWLLMSFSEGVHYYSLVKKHSAEIHVTYDRVTEMMRFPVVIMLLFFNFFVDAEPRFSFYGVGNKPCPKMSSSFSSRLAYSWFTGFAWAGFKHPLTFADLWTIDPEMSAHKVVSDFDRVRLRNQGLTDQDEDVEIVHGTSASRDNTETEKKVSILTPLMRAFGPAFTLAMLLELISSVLMFANPQILELLIGFTKNKNEPVWRGYLYAFLMLSATSLQTLFTNQYYLYLFTTGLRIQTALTGAIYKKAMRISNAARKNFTVGEIVNLMSVDAQRFSDVISTIVTILSAPLQIALALLFLWRVLGMAVFAGVAIMAFLIPLNAFLTSKTEKLQLQQMEYKDQRVKLTNEVLNGMKVLKLYAWEPSFEEQILKIRNEEIRVLKKAAYFEASFSFLWACAPFLICFATFAVFIFIDKNNVLDSKTAFVSLSLFDILRYPMMLLPILVTEMIQVFVSTKRINKFMSSDDLNADNVHRSPSHGYAMEIENGTFSWDLSNADAPILKDINVRVKQGELVAVVGVVGSGKSSLIAALLGEMQKAQGTVNVDGSTAYVPQQAWIQNATLRDNILFGKSMDETLYRRIVHACALTQDFEMLPAGDSTEIGEKGINLSGGQKQRVSLARAVYSDADIYLLDDPLSAVDSHVGKHIFENLIGPQGLLRSKTRLLVTHGISHLAQVDRIYVLLNGLISESGTYKQLQERRGAFAEFLAEHQQDGHVKSEEATEEIKNGLEGTTPPSKSDARLNRTPSKISGSTDGWSEFGASFRTGSGPREEVLDREGSSEYLEGRSENNQDNNGQSRIGDRLIEDEEAESGKVKRDVYIHYGKSIGWPLIVTTLVIALFSHACTAGSNVWLNVWSSNSDKLDNRSSTQIDNTMYLGVYGVFGLGQGLATTLAALSLALGCLVGSRKIFELLIRNVLRSPMSFFDTTPSGRILNRLGKDIDTIDNSLPIHLRESVYCILSVISTLSVICYSFPIFICIIAPLAVLYYLVQQFYVATSRQLSRLESISRSPIYSHFSESITGSSVIRAHRAETRFLEESEKRIDLYQMCHYPSRVADRWLAVRLETMGNILVFFAALFAVIARDTVNAGLVGLAVTSALQVTQLLSWIVRMTSDVETNIVAVERLKEYSETPQEAAWHASENNPSSGWPERGSVEFRGLKLRYREGLELVLKGLNLSVNGGEKVGIVGRTGAGKSSLTIALFRIVEAADGQILIDNVDISKLGLHALRSRLTIIPQDPVLFSGSLRINLDPSNEYSDDDLWAALASAHLKDFVSGLTHGLSHHISEGGENLSVGQKQLICLARALLRKTKVLILDEATAAVDLETDDLIQRTIRAEFKDCTVLTIAHRLNTILDSDRILVLDKGVAVEYDTPRTLLDNPDGALYNLAKDAGITGTHK